jgi:hypothetical protein
MRRYIEIAGLRPRQTASWSPKNPAGQRSDGVARAGPPRLTRLRTKVSVFKSVSLTKEY